MATLNVSLPDEMRAFVDREVDQGRYATASAYVQELIRQDLRRAEARQLMLDGLRSPVVGPWEDVRRRLHERATGRG